MQDAVPEVRHELRFTILFLILIAALVLAGCRTEPGGERQPAGTGSDQAIGDESPSARDDGQETDLSEDSADESSATVKASPTPTSTSDRVASGPTQLADAGGDEFNLPQDLLLTATALWQSLQVTAPPPPALTGGSSPGGADAATVAPPPPRTGGGGDEGAAELGSDSLVLPIPTYGLPADLSFTANADPLAPAPPRAPETQGFPTQVPPVSARPGRAPNAEGYADVVDNPFENVRDTPLSTFSIDVDTASYSNVRRFVNGGSIPPPGAVRIEELLNYFDYDYPPPAPGSDDPFAVFVEVVEAPWQVKHRLVHIGIKGAGLAAGDRPYSNLVFLIDVSGSMDDPAKLPLVKDALRLLVGELGERDRVAIVTYAGMSSLTLPSTSGMDKVTIADAIGALRPGGSTNGGAGLLEAYEVARDSFIVGGVNRVILATDGDFNVGVTQDRGLLEIVDEQAAAGVRLTALGFGMGNLQDGRLELLADNGDGNYAYIDTIHEAHKVLVEQLSGTLTTIAKDVKIQVEFNPAEVEAYRLIGYENRALAAADFADDAIDAGEIGAGHAVTALYEIVPVGWQDTEGSDATSDAVPLRYQAEGALTDEAASGEMLSLRLRYKPVEGVGAGRFDTLGAADGEGGGSADAAAEAGRDEVKDEAPAEADADADESLLLEFRISDTGKWLKDVHGDVRFAAAVAEYGMLLRGSPYAGNATWDSVTQLAQDALGKNLQGVDPYGYRIEFLNLVEAVQQMQP
jgi:Ca-activated chloride channel family protein